MNPPRFIASSVSAWAASSAEATWVYPRSAAAMRGVTPSSLASFEHVVRRVHQLEAAVRKNPKAPDFDGLDHLLETAVDSSGAAVTPAIAAWLADKQKDEAFILKQQRLWGEERRAAASSSKKKDDDPS